MDEVSRYAVGIDVGTSMVRAVVASVGNMGKLDVIGYGEVPNSGMRRGVVANLAGPGSSIDKVLAEAERMSGHEVNSATISINGASLISTHTEGMIAVGAMEHEINENDLLRVENVAMQGRIPANQEVIEVVPLEYILDGQAGIKNPLGMSGSRLEMRANVVSTLAPNYENLKKAAESAKVAPERLVPAAMAAARAVLTERQRENGVAVVDIGAATTGVAIFEENDLQYIGVVPMGSNNITNDLAVMLAIDPEIADELKRRFASGNFEEGDGPVTLRFKGKEMRFDRTQVNMVVRARLEEIMEYVQRELKKAHYDQKLPEGVVLTGGGAKMRDLDKFVRQALNVAVKIGVPSGLSGVAEAVYRPEYATAVGLMQIAAEIEQKPVAGRKKSSKKKTGGWLGKFFSKF